MTQRDKVLRHLREVGPITPMDAIRNYSITRLAAVIYTLRDEGYIISSKTIKTFNKFGEPCRYSKYKLRQTQC